MKVIPTWHLIRKHWFVSAGLLIVGYVGFSKTMDYLTPPKEIALIIGEPWKDMQARSTATIGDEIPGHNWYREPKQLSYLRFADKQYGFVTPPAKFFTVSFDDKGLVEFIRMSPQVEPLPLQDALNVVLSLQEQWIRGGWVVVDPKHNPAHDNTAKWKTRIAACRADATFWNSGAEKRYQITVGIACFKDDRHPNEQRFLINLAIARPWFEPLN